MDHHRLPGGGSAEGISLPSFLLLLLLLLFLLLLLLLLLLYRRAILLTALGGLEKILMPILRPILNGSRRKYGRR